MKTASMISPRVTSAPLPVEWDNFRDAQSVGTWFPRHLATHDPANRFPHLFPTPHLFKKRKGIRRLTFFWWTSRKMCLILFDCYCLVLPGVVLHPISTTWFSWGGWTLAHLRFETKIKTLCFVGLTGCSRWSNSSEGNVYHSSIPLESKSASQRVYKKSKT